MRLRTQLIFAGASFFAVFCAGIVFDVGFWQAGIHYERTLDGKPLPKITEILVSNSWLSSLFLSLPWFVLLGFPLLAAAEGSGFGGRESFVFRYLAFLSIEIFLTFVLAMALVMPFLPYYPLMKSPEESSDEVTSAVVLGLASVIFLLAIARGWWRRRNGSLGRNHDT